MRNSWCSSESHAALPYVSPSAWLPCVYVTMLRPSSLFSWQPIPWNSEISRLSWGSSRAYLFRRILHAEQDTVNTRNLLQTLIHVRGRRIRIWFKMTCDLCRWGSKHTMTQQGFRVRASQQSVQGAWTPYTNLPPGQKQ